MADFKDAPKYGRQIIDDSFCPDGPLPRCAIEDSASISENERQSWHNANERFAACALMYKWLDEQGILKEKAFCYDVVPEQTIQGQHYDKQINFAIDSKDLLAHRDAMLASGVPNAEKAVSAILAEEGHITEPSHLTGATCLTWTMQTYRENAGSVGRSWETIHEQNYSTESPTGIGSVVNDCFEARRDYELGDISEDTYFDVVKNSVKSLYKLDRTAFLTDVPNSFIHDADKSGRKTVMLPCNKDISDSGIMQLTVDSENVVADAEYDFETGTFIESGTCTIALGDFEANSGAMVEKNGAIKRSTIGMRMDDVVHSWCDARAYINNDGSEKTFFELSSETRNAVVGSLAEKAVQKSYLKQDVELSSQEREFVDIYKKQKALHDSLGGEMAVVKFERDNPNVFKEYNAYSSAISKVKAEHGIQNDVKQVVATKESDREFE